MQKTVEGKSAKKSPGRKSARKFKKVEGASDRPMFFETTSSGMNAKFPDDIVISKRPVSTNEKIILTDNQSEKRRPRKAKAPAKLARNRSKSTTNLTSQASAQTDPNTATQVFAIQTEINPVAANKLPVNSSTSSALVAYRKPNILDTFGYWLRQNFFSRPSSQTLSKKRKPTADQIRILIAENQFLRREVRRLRAALEKNV